MIWDNESMFWLPVNKSRNLLKSQANFFSLCDYWITSALKLLNARKTPLLENEGLISSRLSPDGHELFYITGQLTQNLVREKLYRLIHFQPQATENFRRNWYVYNLKAGVRKLRMFEPGVSMGDVKWTPGGKHLSFTYEGRLYLLPTNSP